MRWPPATSRPRRRAIVNPGTLDRERQLEVCLQCHLEPTSSPLPYQLRRVGRPPHVLRPGNAAGGHVPLLRPRPDRAAAKDPLADKFEIAGAAYRLAKSACFQGSQMTCLTCHDPHDVPRGDAAVTALHRGLPGLPSDGARRRHASGGWRRTTRDLHRLPHAAPPDRGRRPRGDDGPLHPARAAGARPDRAARGSRDAGRQPLPGRGGAVLSGGAAADAGHRAVPGAGPGAAGRRTWRRASPGCRRQSRATGRRRPSSTTSSPAPTPRRATRRRSSAGPRPRSPATPRSLRR